MATNMDNFWRNPIFSRFWQTYHRSQAWSKYYVTDVPTSCRTSYFQRLDSENENGESSVVSSTASIELEKFSIMMPPPPPPPPLHCCPHTMKKKPRLNNKRRRKMKLRQNLLAIEEEVIVVADTTVNPDFVEFLSHSIKHRIERQKSRNESESWLQVFDEYTPIDRVGINTRIVNSMDSLKAPTGDYEEIRIETMRSLYGAHAEKILDLECSVQAQFDEYFDKYHPPLWPNMPLKL